MKYRLIIDRLICKVSHDAHDGGAAVAQEVEFDSGFRLPVRLLAECGGVPEQGTLTLTAPDELAVAWPC